ncbi:MAG: hypothetical protein UX13_C0016G0015 [Candidatus Woesebacteria bacterium GW2011_GWB1_45_5]|uniref:Uncharacterized protein n=1 Tax=Candidatus Woesebacteria bacterium GW2011_GWB1_45_5 TaxID=1618581 RepID=A0A0G1PXT9_9BACT|nr:MAG: hypothetical protein UX13_C0016G0015 [Candidatus Woesebacteria bacterium GW2011_GWB1_45_5]
MIDTNLLAGVVEEEGRIGNPVFKGTVLENLSMVPDPGAFFGALLPKLIGLALIIGVLTFLFMFITGAIAWIASGGDKQALLE